ncbi:MAG: IS1182 family transposase [Verrucomicrobia bacterium]|nr:MAG: IS1182 family transposase [Verrucomicrobiota bacterium]
MGKTFRSYDMNQQLLLPPDLRQWLRPDHLALYVSDVVEALDLSGILKVYEEGDGRGRPPYHPVLMVKLLIYGYCIGKMSSRKIEQATHDDVAFRVLSCNQQPDHDSIAEFRKRHLPELAKLFVQVLELCQRAGLVKLGHVAIDGTKIKANASKWQTMSYARMTEAEQELAAEVERLLAAAQRVDDEEDKLYGQGQRGDELPADLRNRESRLARIRELKADMEREAREAAEKKAEAAKQRNKEHAQKEQESGQKFRGRPARVIDPEQVIPAGKTKRNFTDPDSRIMKDHGTKTFQQAYNIQIGVDAQAQIIVAAKVVQAGVDQEQLVPLLREVEKNLGRLPNQVSADAGYYSRAAITHQSVRDVDLHVPPNQRKPLDWGPEVALPENATLQERMWHKLGSKAGREVFSKRKVIVEPVFAQVKHVRGFRQFLLRGLAQVEAEWLLVCMTHNLMKMFRATKQLQMA